jgi:N-acetylglucosaminyldiphosphoundecaprenol N-acetyl-beta-D-mannosaminyltransferase
MGWPQRAGHNEKASEKGPRRLLDIAGFRVSPLSFTENVALIQNAALAGHGLWVMTLNLEMVARAATDARYRSLIRHVDLTVADGMPIVLLSRLGLTQRRIPGRSCGVDIVEHCLTHFRGRMGILGGRMPRATLQRLSVDPARIVFLDDGPVDPATLGPVIAALKASRCQLLFVALGVPKQDIVCRALHEACPGLVCLGVGGSFTILGGFLPRAPRFVRDNGFEWLFRLIQEPRRLAYRYLLLYPRALPSLISWVREMRAKRKSPLRALAQAAHFRRDRLVKR